MWAHSHVSLKSPSYFSKPLPGPPLSRPRFRACFWPKVAVRMHKASSTTPLAARTGYNIPILQQEAVATLLLRLDEHGLCRLRAAIGTSRAICVLAAPGRPARQPARAPPLPWPRPAPICHRPSPKGPPVGLCPSFRLGSCAQVDSRFLQVLLARSRRLTHCALGRPAPDPAPPFAPPQPTWATAGSRYQPDPWPRRARGGGAGASSSRCPAAGHGVGGKEGMVDEVESMGERGRGSLELTNTKKRVLSSPRHPHHTQTRERCTT